MPKPWEWESTMSFFRSLAVEAKMALHFSFLNSGENEHHRVESMFKGFARSLRMAVKIDEQIQEEIPSTKGTLLGIRSSNLARRVSISIDIFL